MFFRVIINTRASTKLTVGYKQYLVYNNIIQSIDIGANDLRIKFSITLTLVIGLI